MCDPAIEPVVTELGRVVDFDWTVMDLSFVMPAACSQSALGTDVRRRGPNAEGEVKEKARHIALLQYHSRFLLPGFAFNAFDKMLGPALIATGLMLLFGLGTRISLFLQGLIYIALTVGLILIHQDDGVSWLGIHIALVALALVLSKHNKLALLKKW